jgi:hypothetical protein
MLLEPFEEQFNLPARLLERADGDCRLRGYQVENSCMM